MKKFIFTALLFSMVQSQDKMILNTGKEIILSDRINFTNYDANSYFIMFNSNRYRKSKIALLRLHNGRVLFRSGMTISKYNSLPIINKALADKKFSSKNFDNKNYDLLASIDASKKQIYLQHFNSTKSSSHKSTVDYIGNLACAGGCITALAILVIFNVGPWGTMG